MFAQVSCYRLAISSYKACRESSVKRNTAGMGRSSDLLTFDSSVLNAQRTLLHVDEVCWFSLSINQGSLPQWPNYPSKTLQ